MRRPMIARNRPCGTLSVLAAGANAFAFPPREASTSRFVTRPPGPLPAISLRRIPFSPARRRARGEAPRPPRRRPAPPGARGGPPRHQQPANGAAGRGLHLDRGLVGLDLRQDLALFYRFTFGTQPAHQLALGHVETEFRHGDDFGHQSTSFTARTTSETCGSAICSRGGLYGGGG